MGGQYYQYLTILTLSASFTVFATLCNILTLMLVRLMRKWNGYLAIITVLVICQIVYDITFYVHYTVYLSGPFLYFITGLNFCGGLAAQLFSNILALVILSVVRRNAPIDILANFRLMCTFVLLPCFTLFLGVLLEYSNSHAETGLDFIYFTLRIVSVLVNFFATGLTWYIGRQMRNTEHSRSQCDMAILVLSRRMIYYPLVQAISRLPKIILDCTSYAHKGLHDSHAFEPGVPQSEFILSIFVAILNPMASVGYFVIFITMQPSAYSHFMSLIRTGKPWRSAGEVTTALAEIQARITSHGIDSSGGLSSVGGLNSLARNSREKSLSLEYAHSLDITGMDEDALVQHILQSDGRTHSVMAGSVHQETETAAAVVSSDRKSRVRFSIEPHDPNRTYAYDGRESQVFEEGGTGDDIYGDVSMSSRGSWNIQTSRMDSEASEDRDQW